MKLYTKVSLVGIEANDPASLFQNQLVKKIEEFQVDGYGAEIQFQANGAQCLALVLQYEEV